MTELFAITPLDRSLEPALRAALDGKAKPPGSLGRIEDLAVKIGLIQQSLSPQLDRCRLLLFAGDHGLTRSGVSSYPASVTVAMVQTLLAGKASASAFAAAVGAEVAVIDAGVAADLAPHLALIDDHGPDGAISADGRVAGAYVHGLFNAASARAALLSPLGVASEALDHNIRVESALDSIAAHLDRHLDIAALAKIAGLDA